jgi:hypothetical protein
LWKKFCQRIRSTIRVFCQRVSKGILPFRKITQCYQYLSRKKPLAEMSGSDNSQHRQTTSEVSMSASFDVGRNRTDRAQRKQSMPPSTKLPLLTRQQLVRFLNENGFPISEATLNKLSAPKVGQGPPIHSWWGRRPLYAPDPSLKWARSLLRDKPSDIATPPSHDVADLKADRAARD